MGPKSTDEKEPDLTKQKGSGWSLDGGNFQTIPQRAGVAAGFCSNQSRAHSLTNQLSED